MSALAGTWSLVRLILRRDRVVLPMWLVSLTIIPIGTVSAVAALYETSQARELFARAAATNPALVAIYGPVHSSSLGGLITWRYGLIVALWIAIANLLTAIRHTRTEEEAGRRELVGSAAVGRQAPLAAVLVVMLGADLLLAAAVAAGLVAQDLPIAGSVALGLLYGGLGAVFAAVGTVSAQLSRGAGGARGIALAVLGATFAIRGIGDIAEEDAWSWLSWLSPFGWASNARPFADERWWAFGLTALAVVALSAMAFALSSRRDLDAGVLPARLGPAQASPGLRGPLSLAWRLHRARLVAWTVGGTTYGLFVAVATQAVTEMLKGSPQLEQVFAALGGQGGFVDAFLSVVMGILGVLVSAYAISAALQMSTEETRMRAEPVLAASVGRLRWAASHAAFALGGPAVILVLTGAGAGLTYGLVTDDVGRELPRLLAASMVQLPAVWVLAGIAIALYGLLPRFAAAGAWTALALFVFLGQLGELFGLDESLLDLSPYTHVPKLPAGEFSWTPLLGLAAVAAVLTFAGLAGFRRRDVVA